MEDISLFTQEELKKMKLNLFETQYNEYMRTKKLLKEVEALKKEKNIIV